jgi:RNA polymerase sigma factor (sigma-70 family)
VHLRLSEVSEARERYEQALPVYQAIGDKLGEANCLQALGDMHLSLSEVGEVHKRYAQALPAYYEQGDMNNDYFGQLVLEHWGKINKWAQERFRDSNLALEAADYVLEKLQEESWGRVQQYRGTGSFLAFLRVTAKNLLEEFARKKFGRVRIPSWVKSQGSLAVRIFKLLCWEHLSRTDVVEVLRNEVPGDQDIQSINQTISNIFSRKLDCGNPTEPTESLSLNEAPEVSVTPEPHILSPTEQGDIINAVYELVTGSGENKDPTLEPVAQALANLKERLMLSEQDKLLLRMVYEDGMKVSKAGQCLGLSVTTVHNRMRALRRELVEAFDAAGMTEVIRELPELLKNP